MVRLAGLGPADCQTVEHAVRDRRGGAEARGHPPQDVGERDRLPRRVWCQGHATAAPEAGAVATGNTNRKALDLSQQLRRERNQKSARAVSVPWRGRETGNVRY